MTGLKVSTVKAPNGAKSKKSKGTVFSRLGELVVRKHRIVVVLWVIALVAVIPAVLNEGNALSLSQGGTSGNNLESVRASNIIQAQFGSTVPSNSLIIVVTGKNITTPAVQDTINTLVSQIKSDKNLTGVQSVTSVYSVLYPVLNSTSGLAHRLLNQTQLESLAGGVAWKPSRFSLGPRLDSVISSFVSPNANTTLVAVNENVSSTDNVLAIRSIISGMGLSNGLTGSPSSASGISAVQVTGGDAISHDFGGSTTSDLGVILPVTIALLIVATGLFFRSVVTPFVALTSIGVALGISQVFVVLAGTFIAKVDFTIPTILLTIVIGVGTDYSVFIISRYREERVKGLPAKEAIVTSVTWAGESIATSGATVIISFLSLTFTSVTFLKTMGVVVGLGVLVALLVALTLVPSVVAMLSESIFWPTAGKRFAAHSKGVLSRLERRSGYFSKSGTFSVKHAKPLMVVALLVSLPALYVYLGTTPTYDFLAGAPSNLESVSASNHLTSGFGGGRLNPSYVVVSFAQTLWNGSAFDAYEMGVIENMSSYLASNPDIANVTGPTMPFGHAVAYSSAAIAHPSNALDAQTRTAMLQTIGRDNKTALITLTFRIDPSSTKALDDAQGIRNYLHANYDAKPDVAQVLLGGASGGIVDTRQVATAQFNLVVPLVAVGVALVLFIVLDSLVLPIFALISVLMSIIWTLALTEVVFKHFYNYDLLFITPLFLFVTLLGLGMDYNIFILTRVREESRKDNDRDEAVIRAIENTGGVISAAAVILAGSLGALMLSGDLLLKQIGFAFSFSILVDALFVRTYLVPAVMSFLGRWNWYNPASVLKRSRELYQEPAAAPS
ncbi:MAG TPA: MMPL family transporter [Nitrososphaerales archaeon]|nr:MMPL family transporter [Nitrososphaerales archaeon]